MREREGGERKNVLHFEKKSHFWSLGQKDPPKTK